MLTLCKGNKYKVVLNHLGKYVLSGKREGNIGEFKNEESAKFAFTQLESIYCTKGGNNVNNRT